MPPEDDAARQLRLVRKAIVSGLGGCFEFAKHIPTEIRNNPDFEGYEPQELKRLAVEYVKSGGCITQRREEDEEWIGRREFDYWYWVCFRVDGIAFPMFMKIVLTDDEEDLPEAEIVKAHASR